MDARELEEGIALRPCDIDIIWINGYGFPSYRGGPMFYADTVGVAKVHAAVEKYRRLVDAHLEGRDAQLKRADLEDFAFTFSLGVQKDLLRHATQFFVISAFTTVNLKADQTAGDAVRHGVLRDRGVDKSLGYRPPKDKEKFFALLKVEAVDGGGCTVSARPTD